MGALGKYRRISGKDIARLALAALGTLMITACLALSAFARLSADGKVYYNIQLSQNVDAGITGEEMLSLDLMLADYLAGDETALDRTDAFNDREKAHMLDVFNIFETVRMVRNALFLPGFACLIVAAIIPSKGRKRFSAGAFIGAALFFLPIIAVAVWASVDFSSAFTAMHHLLFTNDLWLLDPRTDLMIRMLPQRFFAVIAAYLAAGTALAAAVSPFLCAFFMRTLDRIIRK